MSIPDPIMWGRVSRARRALGAYGEPAESDIPMVFFGGTLPETKDDTVMPFRYVSKTETLSGYCKTKAQGSSSMSYPKKNQTVKLYRDAACTEKLQVNFKGWGRQSKFCFKANWIDITHARNIVSARLWGETVQSRRDFADYPAAFRGSPNMGAVDGFPVRVYADGVYQGRYTVNIPKDPWMAGMDENADTHCILCGQSNSNGSALFRAAAVIDGTDWEDEVHDAVPAAILTRWNEVMDFVMNSSDEEFKNRLDEYFYVSSLLDYYLFGLASCGLDAFGKNQLYMTYDGRRWIAGMYDMDSTWGLWWDGSRLLPCNYGRGEYQDFADGTGNLLYIRLASVFGEELTARWEELRATTLSVDHILESFERFTDIAPPSLVQADYDKSTAYGKFVNIPSVNTNHIRQLRSYVKDRRGNETCRKELYRGCLPEGYVMVPYIESDGTQYIDTEISGGVNAAYEIEFETMGSVAHNFEHYFAGSDTLTIPKLLANVGGGSFYTTMQYDMAINDIALRRTAYPADSVPCVIRFAYRADGKTYRNGLFFRDTPCGGKGWGELPWYVCGSSGESGLTASMRLYRLRMWTDGVVVRDFVPAVRSSDGVAGLFDVVDGRFFENSGSGAFRYFTGDAAEYRPTQTLPDGYDEIVLDETSGVSIPGFPQNPSGHNGITHLEFALPGYGTEAVFPPEFPVIEDLNKVQYVGSSMVSAIKLWSDQAYINFALPMDVVGTTVESINAWLAEHHIVIYIKPSA